MSKFRSLILIIGLLLIAVAAALLTVLILYATDVIRTDPVELVLLIEDEKKVYDGTPLKAEEYRLIEGELLNGHSLQVEFTGSQTNAGESESDLVAKVVDEKGFDVTKEYSFKTEKGKLTVDPVEINVEIQDKEVPYNGKQIDFADCVYKEGTLVRGHKLVAVSDEVLLTAGQQLTKENLQVLVYDPFDNPVTENYALNVEMEGVIKVVRRPITIKPVGATKIYDGSTLTCTGYEITSDFKLAPNQTVTVAYYGDDRTPARLTEAGELRIHIDRQKFEISDENALDVTDNYDVVFDTDFLTIQRRPITVRTHSDTFTFDNKEHKNDKVEIYGNLVAGQVFNVKKAPVVKEVTKEDVQNKIEESDYEILSNGSDVKKNYLVSWDYGTLKVTARPVTITLKNLKDAADAETKKYVYDNAESIDIEVADALDSDDLKYGLEASDFTIKWTDGEIKTAGKHSYSVSFTNQEKQDNYLITVIPGTVDVAKKRVVLEGSSVAELFMTYNGTGADGLYKPTLDTDVTLEIEGETYVVTDAKFSVEFDIQGITDIQFARQYVYVESVKVALSEDDIDVDITDNLEVDCSGVEIEVKINARTITFTYAQYSYYEDEEINPATLLGCVGFSGLASGDNLSGLDVYSSPEDSYYAVSDFAVYNTKNENVTVFYTYNDDASGSLQVLRQNLESGETP